MNLERAEMQAILAGKRNDIARLKSRFAALAGDIRRAINPVLSPAEDVEMAELGRLFGDLEQTWVEIQGLRADIIRIEKELA
jgi:hypothetical protein